MEDEGLGVKAYASALDCVAAIESLKKGCVVTDLSLLECLESLSRLTLPAIPSTRRRFDTLSAREHDGGAELCGTALAIHQRIETE
jgi:hypothetical protein